MMTMGLMRQTRRRLLRAGFFAFAMSVSVASEAWGTPCDPTIFQPVPQCQVQTQPAVGYSGWETSYWAFYCSGDHPYFWGMSSGWILNFTWDNSCFSAIENVFGENQPNKFEALFTNWCITPQNLTVTLGCSRQPPPGFAPECKPVGEPVGDPGCKQEAPVNHCSSSIPPICFQTVTEVCDDGTRYYCTADIGIVWCYKCG